MKLPEASEVFRERTVVAFALLGAAAFLIASGLPAAATDSDGDGIPDDIEASTARNVLTHSTPDTFVVRSRSVGAPQDDAFEVSYVRGVYTVAYSPRSFGPDSVSYSVEFRRIEEVYVDTGGETRVAKEWDLRSDFAGVTEGSATTTDGEREVVYSAATQSGLFTTTVAATERFARIDGLLLSPMEVKLTLAIQNWAWNRTDSRLRLEVEVNTTDSPRVDDVTEDEARGWAAADEAQVNVTAASDSVFFSWERTATVDGVGVPVEVTPLEAGSEGYEMYFVYPRGDAIVHDPKLGAVSEAFWSIWSVPHNPPIQADLAVYIVGIGVAAGLVAATVLVRRRRREGREP